MTRVQRFLAPSRLAVLFGLLLAACASSGSTEDGDAAVLVTLFDFKSGSRFELASQTHTDRVAYYSDARADAVRKVVSDEFMAAFVDALEGQGLADHARSGQAPSIASGGTISWGLEVERGKTREHWLVGKGSDLAAWQDFQKCRDLFLELYNYTVSFQTMENRNGKGFFDEQARSASGKER